MTKATIASTFVSLLLVACAAETSGELNGGRGGAGGAGGEGESTGTPGDLNGDGIPDSEQGGDTVPGSTPPGAEQCKGAPHVGFANFDFVSDRKPGDVGVNRRRVKPYTALSSEFQRAIGAVPAGLPQAAAAFGQTPARWYAEPTAGAVSLYTMYTLSFTSCYDTMTDAKFTQTINAASATTECTAMQRKYWQRTPTPEETKACSDLVTTGLSDEPLARRRWAHACASVLTSVGFTTY